MRGTVAVVGRSETRFSWRRILLVPAAAAMAMLFAHQAEATAMTAASSASGESVSLTIVSPLTGSTTVTSGPAAAVAGSAPAAYNQTQSVASALVTGVLSTGVMTDTAASNVDALAGYRFANAASTVNGLNFSILSLLGLTADTVMSMAEIDAGSGLQPVASTVITNLKLNGATVATAGIAANTVILNAAGVTVTLNEQTLTGVGTGTEALTVNAIDIQLDNAAQPILGDVLGRSNLLSGRVIIGQSTATLTAVPEPASLVVLSTLAIAVIGLRTRRPRQSA